MPSKMYVSCSNANKPSAFWGQSFVTELTRISEQADKKAKLRRESSSITVADGMDTVDKVDGADTPRATDRGDDADTPRAVDTVHGFNGERGLTHANGPAAE